MKTLLLSRTRPKDLSTFANRYAERNIAVCPLALDQDGVGKIPVYEDYSRLRPADNGQHDWKKAAGLGLVLGKPSGNLAVLDVDEIGLAGYLRQRLQEQKAPPLMARTARGRLHVFCVEPSSSAALDLEVTYQGRRCLVQILAAGCVVAAHPTPGYSWLNPKSQPFYGIAGAVWNRVAKEFGLPYREARPYSFLRHQRSRGPTTNEIREAGKW